MTHVFIMDRHTQAVYGKTVLDMFKEKEEEESTDADRRTTALNMAVMSSDRFAEMIHGYGTYADWLDLAQKLKDYVVVTDDETGAVRSAFTAAADRIVHMVGGIPAIPTGKEDDYDTKTMGDPPSQTVFNAARPVALCDALFVNLLHMFAALNAYAKYCRRGPTERSNGQTFVTRFENWADYLSMVTEHAKVQSTCNPFFLCVVHLTNTGFLAPELERMRNGGSVSCHSTFVRNWVAPTLLRIGQLYPAECVITQAELWRMERPGFQAHKLLACIMHYVGVLETVFPSDTKKSPPSSPSSFDSVVLEGDWEEMEEERKKKETEEQERKEEEKKKREDIKKKNPYVPTIRWEEEEPPLLEGTPEWRIAPGQESIHSGDEDDEDDDENPPELGALESVLRFPPTRPPRDVLVPMLAPFLHMTALNSLLHGIFGTKVALLPTIDRWRPVVRNSTLLGGTPPPYNAWVRPSLYAYAARDEASAGASVRKAKIFRAILVFLFDEAEATLLEDELRPGKIRLYVCYMFAAQAFDSMIRASAAIAIAELAKGAPLTALLRQLPAELEAEVYAFADVRPADYGLGGIDTLYEPGTMRAMYALSGDLNIQPIIAVGAPGRVSLETRRQMIVSAASALINLAVQTKRNIADFVGWPPTGLVLASAPSLIMANDTVVQQASPGRNHEPVTIQIEYITTPRVLLISALVWMTMTRVPRPNETAVLNVHLSANMANDKPWPPLEQWKKDCDWVANNVAKRVVFVNGNGDDKYVALTVGANTVRIAMQPGAKIVRGTWATYVTTL